MSALTLASLLKHGADGSYRRADGCDSWQLALRSGNRDAIRLLGPSPIHRLSFDSEAYRS